jgi:hypothetical protein
VTAAEALIPMPLRPDDVLRVNGYFPFEEGGRRLLFVVDNAAFSEMDEAGWHLATTLAGTPRVSKKQLLRELGERFGEAQAAETLLAFEQLEILEPADRPRLPADMASFGVMGPLASLVLHVAHDCNLRCGYLLRRLRPLRRPVRHDDGRHGHRARGPLLRSARRS